MYTLPDEVFAIIIPIYDSFIVAIRSGVHDRASGIQSLIKHFTNGKQIDDWIRNESENNNGAIGLRAVSWKHWINHIDLNEMFEACLRIPPDAHLFGPVQSGLSGKLAFRRRRRCAESANDRNCRPIKNNFAIYGVPIEGNVIYVTLFSMVFETHFPCWTMRETQIPNENTENWRNGRQ